MAKSIKRFVFIFMLFMLSSCAKESPTMVKYELIYDFDVETIAYPEKVSTFSVEPIRFSMALLEETILQTAITTTETTALGPVYRTELGEYLMLYDDGEAFGTKTGLNGGFSYGFSSLMELSEESFPYHRLSVMDVTKQLSDLSFYQEFDFQVDDYQQPMDLSFATKEQASAAIEAVFQKISEEEITLTEEVTYTLTTEKMREQIASSTVQEEFVRLPTEKDEAYIFHLQQVIAGMPLVTQEWENRTAEATHPRLIPKVVVTYTQVGAILIEARYLMQERSKLTEVSILSPEIILASFEKQLLLADRHMESLDLEYLPVFDKEGIKLIPVWRLTTWQTTRFKTADEQSIEYPKYQIFMFNAETGKIIEGAIEE